MANTNTAVEGAAENNNQTLTEPVSHVKYWPIEATVWRTSRLNSEGALITSLLATVEKRFKKEDGSYGSTNFIEERDLPLASKALADAHTRIQQIKARDQREKLEAEQSMGK